MMNSNLARVLIGRGVIRTGTVIDAYQAVRGLSCACDTRVISPFTLARSVLLAGSTIAFDTVGPDQKPCRVVASEVISVDGMPIDRLALAQGLSLEGEALPARRRRGRRRKQATSCRAGG